MSELGEIIGQFVTGSFSQLILRQKADREFEIGQLLVAGVDLSNYAIYQINDLMYGSQIPENALELMSGFQLEREKTNLRIYEPELRNYVLAHARALVHVTHEEGTYNLTIPKTLPEFFGAVYDLNDDHLRFLQEAEIENPIFIGRVRSGSRVLDTTVNLEAKEVITHHVLIPATTGRGKSNLVKVVLYNILENSQCGKLVLDPHNEYRVSLNQHPRSRELINYYTIRENIIDSIDLRFNTHLLRPSHVLGALRLTPAQTDALYVYYRDFGENWIQNIFTAEARGVAPATMVALQRRLSLLLNIRLEVNDQGVEVPVTHGIFCFEGNENTVTDIVRQLEEGQTVIVDTSLFGGKEEIFIATIIVEAIFWRYKQHKFAAQLDNYPVVSIVLEEAPRVIGKKELEVTDNVFGTIAKEGRKFNIGLIAITQLPSIIPREILANMNTKIVLGNEMGPEKKAIIESAAQDLSQDYQNIGSLDKGEAIITSNFTKFAIPVKIPLYEDMVKERENSSTTETVTSRSPF
ncbi:MAG: ATP-binding protein [Candidatus Hodarchaeales archaeon]|jgi:DNA helicase HerA-like ATPase